MKEGVKKKQREREKTKEGISSDSSFMGEIFRQQKNKNCYFCFMFYNLHGNRNGRLTDVCKKVYKYILKHQISLKQKLS